MVLILMVLFLICVCRVVMLVWVELRVVLVVLKFLCELVLLVSIICWCV